MLRSHSRFLLEPVQEWIRFRQMSLAPERCGRSLFNRHLARAAESALAVDQLRDSLNRIGDSGHLDGRSKLPITIVGSGFTNAAMAAANSNCTANQLTVSVPTGSVTLSNIVIMDSTKITATVQPVQTDPTETATLILWGASSGAYWSPELVLAQWPSLLPLRYGCRRSAGNAAGCAKYRSGRLVSDSHHYLCVAKPLD